MPSVSITELIPVLQVAIGPVVLISGIGLLLLSMTNRLGRAVDRARFLVRELPTLPVEEHNRIHVQMKILLRRADLLRRAIIFASVSVLLAALLIITLFFIALFQWNSAWLVSLLFIACMVGLILSLVDFIRDLNHSLTAMRLDVGDSFSKSLW